MDYQNLQTNALLFVGKNECADEDEEDEVQEIAKESAVCEDCSESLTFEGYGKMKDKMKAVYSSEHTDLLYVTCDSCLKSWHVQCLGFDEVAAEGPVVFDWSFKNKWRCLCCRGCGVCKKGNISADCIWVFCYICHSGYHADCVRADLPIGALERGVWSCFSCQERFPNSLNVHEESKSGEILYSHRQGNVIGQHEGLFMQNESGQFIHRTSSPPPIEADSEKYSLSSDEICQKALKLHIKNTASFESLSSKEKLRAKRIHSSLYQHPTTTSTQLRHLQALKHTVPNRKQTTSFDANQPTIPFWDRAAMGRLMSASSEKEHQLTQVQKHHLKSIQPDHRT